MNRTAVVVIAIVIILALVGAGYWLTKGKYSTNTSATTTPTPTITATQQATQSSQSSTGATTSNVTTINITGNGNFTFTPNNISVVKGNLVKVNFTAQGASHTFTLPDFNVDTGLVSPGTTKTIEFTPDKTGTFEFYCTPHKSMGMTGKLTVVASK